MDISQVRRQFAPAIEEIIQGCQVAEGFVDKDLFRVYIMTIWGNAVIEPVRSGIEEGDLSVLHDYLCEVVAEVLGAGQEVTSCYEYLMTKDGEDSLERLQITGDHREFLYHFAELVLSQSH